MSGAASAEIEVAAKWHWSRWPASQGPDGIPWDRLNEDQREYQRKIARARFEDAIPPGFRIASPEVVAAIERTMEFVDGDAMTWTEGDCMTIRAWLARGEGR